MKRSFNHGDVFEFDGEQLIAQEGRWCDGCVFESVRGTFCATHFECSSPSVKFIPLIEHLKNQMKDPKP
jgi:hypothetical protein